MTEHDYDPFKLDSGLPDDFDITVTNAWWEYDDDYNNGDTLVLKLAGPTGDDELGELELLFPAGPVWTTQDKGITAVREDGKTKNFNGRGGVGLLIGSMMTSGGEGVLRERYNKHGLTPQHAALYKGLSMHMNRTAIDYGGEIGKKDKLICTDFKGEVGAGASGAGAATGAVKKGASKSAAPVTKGVAKKATATPNPLPAPAVESTNQFGLDDAVYERLHAIAAPLATHDEFLEAVLDQMADECAGDENLMLVVSNNEPGSLWDEACERAIAAQ